MTVLITLLISALSQGMLYAPMALGGFITFRILKTPDLTVDGSFVFGMTVCAAVTVAGYPIAALVCGALAGALAGLCTALLQTRARVEPILSGILVSTGLYTVNYAVLGGQSNLYLQREVVNAQGAMVNESCQTLYRMFSGLLKNMGSPLKDSNTQVLLLTLGIVAALIVVLGVFFFTRPGMAIRATGDNPDMVRSSSINPVFTTIIGLCVANSFTALSGCLLAQAQKSVNIDIGGGMVTIALASLLIGNVFLGKKKMPLRIAGMVLGAFVFRLVYTIALRFNMPAFMLKLVSSVIVVAAISIPYIKQQLPLIKRRLESRKREGNANA